MLVTGMHVPSTVSPWPTIEVPRSAMFPDEPLSVLPVVSHVANLAGTSTYILVPLLPQAEPVKTGPTTI